jgi:hypothetical protein
MFLSSQLCLSVNELGSLFHGRKQLSAEMRPSRRQGNESDIPWDSRPLSLYWGRFSVNTCLLYSSIILLSHRTIHCLSSANFFTRITSILTHKQSHNTPVEAQGKIRYSSYSFTTLGLDGSGQRRAPAALFPGERTPRYPLDKRLSGPHSRSGLRGCRKILCLWRRSNLDRPVIQSIARLCTDWTTPAPHSNTYRMI